MGPMGQKAIVRTLFQNRWVSFATRIQALTASERAALAVKAAVGFQAKAQAGS